MGYKTKDLEDKIYMSKTLMKSKRRLKKINFVCRNKKFYQHQALGFWWKKNEGVGIIGKPNRVLKYFMFGMNLVNVTLWVEFTWLGNTKKEPKIKFKDENKTTFEV